MRGKVSVSWQAQFPDTYLRAQGCPGRLRAQDASSWHLISTFSFLSVWSTACRVCTFQLIVFLELQKLPALIQIIHFITVKEQFSSLSQCMSLNFSWESSCKIYLPKMQIDSSQSNMWCWQILVFLLWISILPRHWKHTLGPLWGQISFFCCSLMDSVF